MTAVHKVTLVAAPIVEDAEESEAIVAERQWEDQLQYLITISRRSFIGGAIPIFATLTPLAKIKMHRILTGDCPGAFAALSLVELFELDAAHSPAEDSRRRSELAASFMGFRPWAFERTISLPRSCAHLYFTNRNRRSNVAIAHTLRVVFHLKSGDDAAMDAKMGKRKLSDIVVKTPCRSSPDTPLPIPLPEVQACGPPRRAAAAGRARGHVAGHSLAVVMARPSTCAV